MIFRLLAACGSALFLSISTSGCSTALSDDLTSSQKWSENSNISRRIEGRYKYVNLDDGAVRGNETFSLIEHPSGARTVQASTNIFSRDVHVTSTLVADSTFRPKHAFVSIWTQGRLRGHGHYQVEGDQLNIDTQSDAGALSETIKIPQNMSIISHPIALDGWHFWYVGQDQPAKGSLYYIDGSADFESPMGGRLMNVTLTPLGEKVITVPAGTFEAEGFQIADHSEIWIATEDKLVVEYIWRDLNRRYFLERLETTP